MPWSEQGVFRSLKSRLPRFATAIEDQGRGPRESAGQALTFRRVDSPVPGDTLLFGMKTYTAVVERCPDTGLYVGYIPGFPGAHSQAATLDELSANLKQVVEMLLEDGEPDLEVEFVGTQTVNVR